MADAARAASGPLAGVRELVPERRADREDAPATFQDALQVAQAREEARVREERRRRDKRRGSGSGGHGEPRLTQAPGGEDALLEVATAALGGPARARAAGRHARGAGSHAAGAGLRGSGLLQVLGAPAPGFDPAREPSLLPFWAVTRDYFRWVDREDVALLEAYARDPAQSPHFRIPLALAGDFRARWRDEDAVAHEAGVRAAQAEEEGRLRGGAGFGGPSKPASHKKGKGISHKKGAAAKERERLQREREAAARQVLTTVLSPVEDPAEVGELCDVCFEGESVEGNVILFCDECNVAVHQICYGVETVPEGTWLCRACEAKKAGRPAPTCALCPVKGGAMKPAVGSSPGAPPLWVHLFCSQWIPETYIRPQDTGAMEPVQGVTSVCKARNRLVCSICRQRGGACIQCSHGFCTQAFHPTCARNAGLLMEVRGSEDAAEVELKAYCRKHTKAPARRASAEGGGGLSPAGRQQTLAKASSGSVRKGGGATSGGGGGGGGGSRIGRGSSASAGRSAGGTGSGAAFTSLGPKLEAAATAAEIGAAAAGTGGGSGAGGAGAGPPSGTRAPGPGAPGAPGGGVADARAAAGVGRSALPPGGVKEESQPGQVPASAAQLPVILDRLPAACLAPLVEALAAASGCGLGGAAGQMGLGEGALRGWLTSAAGGADRPFSGDSKVGAATLAWAKGRAFEALARQPGDATGLQPADARADSRAARLAEGLKAVQGAAVAQGHPPLEQGFVERLTALFAAVPVVGEMPEYLRPERWEVVHPYTEALLAARRAETGGGAPASTSTGGAAELAPQMGLIAAAPEDEVTGELCVLQGLLAARVEKNQASLRKLGAALRERLPAEVEAARQEREDAAFVEGYMGSIREAKRAQKREKRAAEQKVVLAQAEAALANSSRHRKDSGGFEGAGGGAGASGAAWKAPVAGPGGLVDPLATRGGEDEALCAVCAEGHSEAPNQIVFCERCDIAVHQKCYGISRVPDGEWLCWPCRFYEDRLKRAGKRPHEVRAPRWQQSGSPKMDMAAFKDMRCALCPVQQGAFKRTLEGEWAHVVCAMWHSEVLLQDTDEAAAITGVERLRPSKWKLSCGLCGSAEGAVVQCSYGHCQEAFHPICGRAHGLYMPIRSGHGGRAIVKAYCKTHSRMMQPQSAKKALGPPGLPAPERGGGAEPGKDKARALGGPSHHAKAGRSPQGGGAAGATGGAAGGGAPAAPAEPAWARSLDETARELETMHHIRAELEHLRLLCDQVRCRARAQRELAKVEHEYLLKRLENPALAQATEVEAEEEAAVAAAGELIPSPGGRQAKRPRTTPRMRVEREIVMSPKDAEEVNQKLPPGFKFVPIEKVIAASPRGS